MSQIQVRDKTGKPLPLMNVRLAIGGDSSDAAYDDKFTDFNGNTAWPNPLSSPNGYTLYVNYENVDPKYKPFSQRYNTLAYDILIVVEKSPLQAIRIDGDDFRTEDGKRWLWNMGSNYCLPHFVAEGRDIIPLLYKNLNGYRMFGTYFNIANQMGMKPFTPQNYPNWLNAIADTFDILLEERKYGQLNLFCDANLLGFNLGQMRDMHREVTDMLKTKKNAFYSLANENQQNGINADDFDRPSGLISACGSGLTGGPAPTSRGGSWDIQHQHLRRDDKMFIDVCPVDAPTYSLQHKIIFDETIGWWGNPETTGSRTGNLRWAYELGKFMGAFNGGTIHLNSGGHSEPLTQREEDAVAHFSLGMLGDTECH